MTKIAQSAESAIAHLLAEADGPEADPTHPSPTPIPGPGQDEDFLYAELGKRLIAISRSTDGSDQFDMAADQKVESYGPLDELKNLGMKFFNRWNESAYDLCCGSDPENADLRKKVEDSWGFGEQAVGATIASLLVVHFGMAAGLAGVVAVLIVRLFFRPGKKGMCDYWKEKLPKKNFPKS